jgi:hypothetical protein
LHISKLIISERKERKILLLAENKYARHFTDNTLTNLLGGLNLEINCQFLLSTRNLATHPFAALKQRDPFRWKFKSAFFEQMFPLLKTNEITFSYKLFQWDVSGYYLIKFATQILYNVLFWYSRECCYVRKKYSIRFQYKVL